MREQHMRRSAFSDISALFAGLARAGRYEALGIEYSREAVSFQRKHENDLREARRIVRDSAWR